MTRAGLPVLGLLAGLAPVATLAESLVAARTLRPRERIEDADVTLVAARIPGALDDAAAAIGLEVRRTIYAGRPVTADLIGPPALVERNALVTLVVDRGGLRITAEGRALDRGGAGDRVAVMNLASRTTLSGVVAADGSILILP
jgi:flagellar basal body P-ring formation protein FlgA